MANRQSPDRDASVIIVGSGYAAAAAVIHLAHSGFSTSKILIIGPGQLGAGQAYGCEALFNFVFRCEQAWVQCQEIGAQHVVEAALELDKRDDYLQRRALNAQKALGPEGWLGRALIRDLKLGEAREMVAKQQAREKKAAIRGKK